MKENFDHESLEKELSEVLSNFRASTQAWSAQEFARVSLESPLYIRRARKLPFRWMVAVCCLVIVASVPVHREQVRKNAQIQAAFAAEEDARLMEDVETAVSQRVPKSMSPLTSLIASDDPGSE
jgi:hypothetical protein